MPDMEARPARVGTSAYALLGAAAVGAALTYFLDPVRGARRRSMVRDRLVHLRARADDAIGITVRDLGNRARGLVAEARGRLAGGDADDSVIEARVRTTLGRVVSHPSAIDVTVDQGRVTLAGPVLATEADALLGAVGAVRGVGYVESRLERHESAENVPGLQGGVRRAERGELAQENWAPATRFVTSVAGTALAVLGTRRGGLAGAALTLTGGALAARGVTNLSARRLTGLSAGRRAVDIQKAITVQAPVERVFAFFTQWDNWPRWMSHVREVRSAGATLGQERTHWIVDGPAGTTMRWDALTTALVPNERIAWKTVEGAAIEHAGVIRFTPTADGATTIDVKMSYNPPAGALGHAVATILGRDPKRQMDDDLARLKTTIETGIPPRDAAQPSIERGHEMPAAQRDLTG